jgi:hypothetical protein
MASQTKEPARSSRESPSPVVLAHAELSAGSQQWLQQIQPPIEFYGKVLDEEEQPVVGASVEFVWTHVHPEADFKKDASSGADGSFSLTAVDGCALDVHVSKQGYYPVKGLNRDNFNYVALPGSNPLQPDPASPIIFYLRKKGPGADLITSRRGVSPEMEISGLTDGTAVRVNFLNHKVAPDGQLELSAVKPPRGQPATRWSFRMSIPDGGFIEENDEFPFEAPQSGYKPTIEFDFVAGSTNWTQVLHKRYYIVFGEPPKYGRIDVQTGIYRGVSLSYAINPDGSRYLEPREDHHTR